MIKIEINKPSDFEILKKQIREDDDIELIIGENIVNIKMNAIDLSRYSGKIKVRFKSPKKQRNFVVDTLEMKENDWIFSKTQKGQVIMSQQHKIGTTYNYPKKTILIKSSIEWKEAFSKPLPKSTKIVLMNDIVLTNPIPNYTTELTIDGNNHTMYAEKKVLRSWKWNKQNVKFKNTRFVPVDHVLEINRFEQIKKIYQYNNERVAVALQNDIKDTYIKPVNLSNFKGTLILLGNGFVLENITLLPPFDNSIGLISSISEMANFICADFTISKLNFPDVLVESVGAIVGRTKKEEEKYKSSPGINLFERCHANSIGNLIGYHYTGILIGRSNENVLFTDCECSFNFNPIEPNLGGDPFYYDDYAVKRKRILKIDDEDEVSEEETSIF